MNYDATLRNLDLIGEVATHIPETVGDANPAIPWRKTIVTRNRLIHAYLDIDTIWGVVQEERCTHTIDRIEGPERQVLTKYRQLM